MTTQGLQQNPTTETNKRPPPWSPQSEPSSKRKLTECPVPMDLDSALNAIESWLEDQRKWHETKTAFRTKIQKLEDSLIEIKEEKQRQLKQSKEYKDKFVQLERRVSDLRSENKELLKRLKQNKTPNETPKRDISSPPTDNDSSSDTIKKIVSTPMRTSPGSQRDEFEEESVSTSNGSEENETDQISIAIQKLRSAYINENNELIQGTALFWLAEVFTASATQTRIQVPPRYRVPGVSGQDKSKPRSFYGYWKLFQLLGLEQIEKSLQTGHNHDWRPKDKVSVSAFLMNLRSTLSKMKISWSAEDFTATGSDKKPEKKSRKKSTETVVEDLKQEKQIEAKRTQMLGNLNKLWIQILEKEDQLDKLLHKKQTS
eukprot:TRINITY_DN10426_c0_g1_i1.p1 TRINITY_DN10426_c0_g1~~TRINITY_DN10426_c0_g1_i1.p1  ORF type:complete len:388 (-),score=85.21 TRINITY_DN10426_c0_g1_i1:48-1163(-)